MKKLELITIIREEIKQLNEGRFPELDKIVMKIAKQTGSIINKEAKKAKTDHPYKAQYILEELIKILESAV